jgi:predicted transcriptional regulator
VDGHGATLKATAEGMTQQMVKQSQRDQLLRYLGPLELRIMEAVWHLEDATVNDVLDRLNSRSHRQLVYNTVMATMARLAEKGHLDRERDGRAYVYSAGTPDDFLRARAVETFDDAYTSLGDLAANAFVEAVAHLPEDDRRDLMAKLKELDG